MGLRFQPIYKRMVAPNKTINTVTSKHEARDADGIPVDPDYQTRIIPEHRIRDYHIAGGTEE